MTRFNAALNEVGRPSRGPRRVASSSRSRGERFDLIATNPPFVISPATGERLVYRDSGLPGDQVVEDIVRAAPDHLTDGGWCQVLANWVIAARPALGRAARRLAGPGRATPCVVQREVVDPAAYVELWLKDAGHSHGGAATTADRYDTWLVWFEEQGVEAVGFGWINLRRRRRAARHDLLDWPYDVEQPIAPAIARLGARRPRTPVRAPSAPAACSAPTCVQETVGAARRRGPRGDRAAPAARASAAPARSTPSRPRWSAPATAS